MKLHIYLICKRKQLFYEDSVLDGNYYKTRFYYLDDNHNKQFIGIIHPLTIKINNYKNGIYDIDWNGTNKQIGDLCMSSLVFQCWYANNKENLDKHFITDLEVMYIGQCFGRKTNRTIDYRLKHNHTKLKKISANASNEEIVIVGINIRCSVMSSSQVVSPKSCIKAPTVADLSSLQQQAQKRISAGQEITVCEAALISYFKPNLNIEYKKTFPSKDFKSTKELYNTNFGFSSFAINLDDDKTNTKGFRLFSQHIQCIKSTHLNSFQLSNTNEIEELFSPLYYVIKNQQQ
ncbi:MAG: hypothetical protein LBM68_06885 [Bacteroidales bacterium]|jgi:hypothetical protein|nr:hypothetical protein [Bacteroidales bacterium]